MKFEFIGGDGNEQLSFDKETVVITDPCYVVPHDNEENNSNKWHEMLNLIDNAEPKLGIHVNNAPISKFISDFYINLLSEMEQEIEKHKDSISQDEVDLFNNSKTEKALELLNAVIDTYKNPKYNLYSSPYIDEDPLSYILPSKNSLTSLGIRKSLVGSTVFGDWSCVVIDTSNNEIIGQFCADAGMYIIAPLKDILEYNPDFKEWMKQHEWCVATIPDFTGYIEVVPTLHSYTHKDEKVTTLEKSIRINGYGSINFTTRQAGF